MLPWQQSMLEHWDNYYVEHSAALKRKSLMLALAIYGLLCLLFFIPHFQQTAPTTVFIKGSAAPVLFMSGTGKGGSSARLRRAHESKKESKKQAEKLKEAQLKKEAAAVKTPEVVPDIKKAVLPERISVVKEPPKKQKTKKELLREKQKEQAAAKAKKLLEAKKLADAKKIKEAKKLADAKKLQDAQKLKEEKAKALADKKAGKKPDVKPEPKVEPVKTEAPEAVDAAGVEDGIQEVIVGNESGDGTGDGSGQGYDPALKSHSALGRAITRVWRPPQVKVTKPVRVMTVIDAQGVVKNTQFLEQSGIVAYDIAARAAVLRAEFPKEFWGKSVTIVFGN